MCSINTTNYKKLLYFKDFRDKFPVYQGIFATFIYE